MADIFDEMVKAEQFVGLVSEGVPPLLAGIEVGWSPAQTKARLKDPEFAEIVVGASDLANACIEQALFQKAKAGNVTAIQMWLFKALVGRRPISVLHRARRGSSAGNMLPVL